MFLRGGAAGAVSGGLAREADFDFGEICLGFSEGKVGFGLRDFGFVGARIDLYEEVAGFHRRIVIDEELDDISGNLRGDGGDVAVHLRVIGGNAAGEDVPRDCDQDDDCNDCASDERREIANAFTQRD